MRHSATSPTSVNVNDLPNMRRTMELKFIGGKLHQKWVDDGQTIAVWRVVDSE